jgi:hypothetical protein
MSKYLIFEVPDSFDLKKKFSSDKVMYCGKEKCAYYTIDLRLLVDHLFYDPSHNNMPRLESER